MSLPNSVALALGVLMSTSTQMPSPRGYSGTSDGHLPSSLPKGGVAKRKAKNKNAKAARRKGR